MKILIPDPTKSRRLILEPMENTLIPIPRALIPDPRLWSLIPPFFRPLIPDPIYLVTTLACIFWSDQSIYEEGKASYNTNTNWSKWAFILSCIECDDEVRPRQQALQCDVYGRSYGLSDHMIDFCIVKVFIYVFTNVQSKFSSPFFFFGCFYLECAEICW